MRFLRERRVVIAAAALAVVSFLVVVAFGVGSWFRSPEQAAADAAPPEPSLITVAVERRILAQPVVLRGKVLPGDSVKIYPPASAVGSESVVTAVIVQPGQTVREGQALLAQAGRPIFALRLAFPLYRDLVPGLDGPDVKELQQALNRIGYAVSVTGRFDDATASAVARFYRDRGFEAPPGSTEARNGLPAARAEVASAQAAVDAAVAAALAAAQPVDPPAPSSPAPGESPSPTPAPPPAPVNVDADPDVVAARAALDRARQSLAALETAAGASLPKSAVIRLAQAEGVVTAVLVGVADVLDSTTKALFELDGGAAYTATAVSRDQVGLLRVGQPASVIDEATGREAAAIVDLVAAEPTSDTTTGLSGFQVRLTFVGEPLPPITDRTVRVDIAIALSGTEVLAIPETALYSGADGSVFVTVARSDGSTVDVTVRDGQAAGGWVEVTPTSRDSLKVGDLVVVGQQTGGA